MKFIKNIQESANELNSGMGKAWHKLWGGSSGSDQSSAWGCNINNRLTKLPIDTAISYYMSVAPIYAAIEIITTEFSSIKPVIKVNGEIDTKHPLNELLSRPNGTLTYMEFAKELVAWFFIAGNSYISVNALNEKMPPVELEIVQPKSVNPIKSTVDRYVESYQLCQGQVFKRQEGSRLFRYFDVNKEHELWQIKTFNPQFDSVEGLSRINALYYESEQYAESSIHNLSLLKNGITSSGIVSTDANLTKEQRDDVRSELKGSNTGSGNAGKSFLFDGGNFDFKDMSKTMKDMDFKDLKRDNTEIIYSLLGIPLPYMVKDAMKFSNFSEARLDLQDRGILPLANRIFQELTNLLSPRYKDEPVITYEESQIPVLRARMNIENERVRSANILTPNESRALDGYPPVENGNILYQPFNLVPLGTEDVTDEESKNTYTELMQKQVAESGQRKYTDSQIEELWNDSKD